MPNMVSSVCRTEGPSVCFEGERYSCIEECVDEIVRRIEAGESEYCFGHFCLSNENSKKISGFVAWSPVTREGLLDLFYTSLHDAVGYCYDHALFSTING